MNIAKIQCIYFLLEERFSLFECLVDKLDIKQTPK